MRVNLPVVGLVASLAACSGGTHPADLCRSSVDARLQGRYDSATPSERAQAFQTVDPMCRVDCMDAVRSDDPACLESLLLEADTGDAMAQSAVLGQCDTGGAPECAWVRAHPERFAAGRPLRDEYNRGVADMNRKADEAREHPETVPTGTATDDPAFAVVDAATQELVDESVGTGWTVLSSTKLLIGGDQPMVVGPLELPTGVEVNVFGLADASCRDVDLEIQLPSSDAHFPGEVLGQVFLAGHAYNIGGDARPELTAMLSAGGAATCPATLVVMTTPLP